MIKQLRKTISSYNDSGLSNTVGNQGKRFINSSGGFNVIKTGVSISDRFSIFNELIRMSWPKFIFFVFVAYTVINLFFACLYFYLGIQDLAGAVAHSATDEFIEEFFFSAQTLTTVGYGRVSPIGLAANIIASTEALIGLLCFALATGLLYARFARPVSNIFWSQNALVAPYRDGKAIMFRLANAKSNTLIDAEINVFASMLVEENGSPIVRFFNLDLERKYVNFLTLNWTVVHPLNENSPLWNLTVTDMEACELEMIITFKSIDETSGQMMNRRHSYKYDEIVWDAKFLPMFGKTHDGQLTNLRLNEISLFQRL